MHEKYSRSFLSVCFLSEGMSSRAVELEHFEWIHDFYLHLSVEEKLCNGFHSTVFSNVKYKLTHTHMLVFMVYGDFP